MRYLSKPTARLPNGRLIVDDGFINALVDAVNQLNDHVKAMEERLDGHDNVTATLSESVEKAGIAIQKMANAMNMLIGD